MTALCRSYASHAEALPADPNGVARMRVAEHRSLKRLLTEAGLDDDAVERDVRALHAGRVLVLVDVPEEDAERVGSLLA